MTGEDWKTHRAAVAKNKLARPEFTDIEADALLAALEASASAGRVVGMPVPDRAALFRAIAKLKIARAAIAPSQAEAERDKRKR